jgi:hypothetical protein
MHYNNFRNLLSYVLKFIHWPGDLDKTGENVETIVNDCLRDFELNGNRFVVTDGGSNMKDFGK